MKTFTCVVKLSAPVPPRFFSSVELFFFIVSAARAEGFLGEDELFPAGSSLEVHKNECEPLYPTLVVLVPEPEDEIERFDALLEGVNLDG